MESNDKENEEIGNIDSNNDARKDPINEININGYKYKYKDTYKKGYCYRCIHRYICKLTILICFTEYKKLFNKEDSSSLKYEINSKQKKHICNIEKIEEIDTKQILTKEEELQLAKMLIKANINESPPFHFNNLNTNNIKWKKKKVENLVYKLQEEKYPKNNLFINEINNTFIVHLYI